MINLASQIQQLIALEQNILCYIPDRDPENSGIEKTTAVKFARRYSDVIYNNIIVKNLNRNIATHERDQIPEILRVYYWQEYFMHMQNNITHVKVVWDAFVRLTKITNSQLATDGDEPKNKILTITCNVIESYLNPKIFNDNKYNLQLLKTRAIAIKPIIADDELIQLVKINIDVLRNTYIHGQICPSNIGNLISVGETMHKLKAKIDTEVKYNFTPEFILAGVLWECYFIDFYPLAKTANNTPIYEYIFPIYNALIKLRDTLAFSAQSVNLEYLRTITQFENACRLIEAYFTATDKSNLFLTPTMTLLTFITKIKNESIWLLGQSQSFTMLESLAESSYEHILIPETGPLATQFYLTNIIASNKSKTLELLDMPQYADLRTILYNNIGLQPSESLKNFAVPTMTASKILTPENKNTLKQLMCNNLLGNRYFTINHHKH